MRARVASKEARGQSDLTRRLKAKENLELRNSGKRRSPARVVANIALCLIHQTNYLLDQQLRRMEKDFLQEGGIRERITRARLQQRNRPTQA